MKQALNLLICATILLFSYSCEKPEGVGGSGTISGKIMVNTYDKEFKVLQESYPADDKKVFIIYGEDEVLSDETSTSFNGMFEFENLSKGNYTIFVYSEDSTMSVLHDIKIDTTLNLSSNESSANIGELTTYKTLDYDDGLATIKGQIMQVNYTKGGMFIIDTIVASEIEVYLVYEDGDNYIERTRTAEDGSYAFPGLLKGDYEVYAYGEMRDALDRKQKEVKSKKTVVNGINDNVSLETIYVNVED